MHTHRSGPGKQRTMSGTSSHPHGDISGAVSSSSSCEPRVPGSFQLSPSPTPPTISSRSRARPVLDGQTNASARSGAECLRPLHIPSPNKKPHGKEHHRPSHSPCDRAKTTPPSSPPSPGKTVKPPQPLSPPKRRNRRGSHGGSFGSNICHCKGTTSGKVNESSHVCWRHHHVDTVPSSAARRNGTTSPSARPTAAEWPNRRRRRCIAQPSSFTDRPSPARLPIPKHGDTNRSSQGDGASTTHERPESLTHDVLKFAPKSRWHGRLKH